MTKPTVFFIRGLNTQGIDHVRWKIFDFGPVHEHVALELRNHNLEFVPITGLGSGSLSEIATRAYAFLIEHPLWVEPVGPVHIFAHSAGGLVARLLIERLRSEGHATKVASLLTFASPHSGSHLADICVNMEESNPRWAKFLAGFGYNLSTRRNFFSELTPNSVARTFSAIPPASDIVRTGSIVCWAPKADWCWPLRSIHLVGAFDRFAKPSDGIVERESQRFGDVLGEWPLDHLRQLGFFSGHRFGFREMMTQAAQFFKVAERR